MTAPAKDLGEGSGREERQADSTPKHEPGKFAGTDNPRYLRALHALLRRPLPREQGDREAGSSNFPDVIAELRRRGLAIPCERAPVIDRDGREVQRGIYHLSKTDRRKLVRWMAARGRG